MANLICKWMSSGLLCVNPYKVEFIMSMDLDRAVYLSTKSSSFTLTYDASVRIFDVTESLVLSAHLQSVPALLDHPTAIVFIDPRLTLKSSSTWEKWHP